jgi:glutathione S-transferase
MVCSLESCLAQPYSILTFPAGPNPWKVALILEELSIPYETKIYATPDLKKPPFITNMNPNGFAPVIEDPNTTIKVWEVSKQGGRPYYFPN